MTLTAEKNHNCIRQKLCRYLPQLIFTAGDYVAVILTGQLSNVIYDLSIDSSYIYLWLPLTFLLFLAHSRAYAAMQPIIYTVRSIFYAITFALATYIVALYFFTDWQAPRSFFLIFWLLMLATVHAERLLLSLWLKKGHHLYEDVILVGAGRTAERALHFFKDDLGYRYHINGFIDDNPISKKLPMNTGFWVRSAKQKKSSKKATHKQ